MSRVGIILGLFCFVALLLPLPAFAAESDAGAIGAGLPQVSSEDFNDKISRMVGALYGDAVKIAPMITLIVFIVGGITGIIWREARMTVVWSVAALILIMWAPQLISLLIHYISQ